MEVDMPGTEIDTLRVRVRDDGKGIGPERLATLFEPISGEPTPALVPIVPRARPAV